MIDHFDKLVASVERSITNARKATRESNTRQATAPNERILADARYTVTNRHTRQAIAPVERIIADTNSISNHNGFE